MSDHKFAILFCLLCGSLPASAAPGDQILIRADSMQFDIKTGNSVYQGHVSFIQDKVELSGHRITVSSTDGSITRIRIEGTPARYYDNSTQGRVLAESANMDYILSSNQLTMQGGSRLEQDDRIVESQNIIYDTEKKLILAGQSGQPASETSDPSQRVNITLTPKKDRTP